MKKHLQHKKPSARQNIGFDSKPSLTKKFVPVEEKKLTKKQLTTMTWFVMTIGEMNLEQIQTCLYYTLREQKQSDQAMQKAVAILENAMP